MFDRFLEVGKRYVVLAPGLEDSSALVLSEILGDVYVFHSTTFIQDKSNERIPYYKHILYVNKNLITAVYEHIDLLAETE